MDEVCALPMMSDGSERRLREIERQLAILRREQRFFRRIGFGENIKAMQAVELQVERRACLAALPSGYRGRQTGAWAATACVILQQIAGIASIGLAVLVVAAKSIVSNDGRGAPRRHARRAAVAAMRAESVVGIDRGRYSEVSPVPMYSR